MLKYMIDTQFALHTIKNRPAQIREIFRAHDGQMCISSVTLMQLIYGAEASSEADRNLRDIEGFAARLEVLPYDHGAAVHTGQLREELKQIGRRIPAYEEMICGHARSEGLVVVTNSMKAFEGVPGVRFMDWVNRSKADSSSG